LEIDESKWFTMTSQQRSNHISKVNSIKMPEFKNSTINQQKHNVYSLSVSAEHAAKVLHLSINNIEGIWKKPEAILKTKNGIVNARMVINYSSVVPHLFTPCKKGYRSMGLHMYYMEDPKIMFT
jgi:hypothetical protein